MENSTIHGQNQVRSDIFVQKNEKLFSQQLSTDAGEKQIRLLILFIKN